MLISKNHNDFKCRILEVTVCNNLHIFLWILQENNNFPQTPSLDNASRSRTPVGPWTTVWETLEIRYSVLNYQIHQHIW